MPENTENRTIRAKIRLDFKGTAKPGKLFFRGKSVERVAEEIREHNIAAFRNIPLQGINILDIDMGNEVYTVYDDVTNTDTAYAPLVIDVVADSLEDLVRMVAREDFRKIEVLSNGPISLSRVEAERVLFRMAEEFRQYRNNLERKYNLK
ncbi:MAG: hypothetical protein K6T66_00020 [Peptococcaceae bacterium]|nr:hypothetical protein [Peptococcaceae bacterium]